MNFKIIEDDELITITKRQVIDAGKQILKIGLIAYASWRLLSLIGIL